MRQLYLSERDIESIMYDAGIDHVEITINDADVESIEYGIYTNCITVTYNDESMLDISMRYVSKIAYTKIIADYEVVE